MSAGLQRRLYRMFDAEPRGVFPVDSEEEARRWNAEGHGIFLSINTFNGARRIENLVRLNAWAIDMDAGTKDEQRRRIERSPLVPSRIVETKRGFQCYWLAKDARPEHWNAIVLDRLVPHFGADKNARDIARILRMPGYYHLKDPSDPFLVQVVHRCDVRYSERELAMKFEPAAKRETDRRVHQETVRQHAEHRAVDGDDFWERIYNLNCEEGLARLSGHHAVNGEKFSFRRTARGTRNIFVDDKGTSCWVDRDGRIGSLSNGGPTLYQWLAWYGHAPREVVRVLKQVFPELETKR